MTLNSLLKFALDNGGVNYPIDIPNTLKRGAISTNPSCVVYKDDLLVNTRLVNYVKAYLINDYKYGDFSSNQDFFYSVNGYNSQNVIGCFVNGSLNRCRYLGETQGLYPVYYTGLEDVRLVVWNEKLYAYGTRLDVTDRIAICFYELNDDFQIVKETIVDSPTHSFTEKNWAAVEDRPFTFVYFTNPQTIIEVNPEDGTTKILSDNKEFANAPHHLRGNSNVIRFDDNRYIELVHETRFNEVNGATSINYYLAFVLYDNDLNIIHASELFNFTQSLCEFSCGMCIQGDNVYIAYSELDASANMIMVSKDKLLEFIYHADEYQVELDKTYFIDKVNGLLRNGNFKQTLSFIMFCLNNEIYANEEKYEKLILTLGFICQEIYRIPDGNYNTLEQTLDKIMSEGYKVKECLYMKSIIYRARGDIGQSKMYRQMADETEGVCSLGFLSLINPHYL